MAPEVRTYVVAAVTGRDADSLVERAHHVLARAGGADVGTEVTADGSRLVTARFHNVSDSTRAVAELARSTAGLDGDGAGARPAVRIAMCTDAVGDDGGTPGARARRLLTHTAPGQVLLAASTAVVAGRGLPPGTELLDEGSYSLADGQPAERVYEFRIDRDDDTAASNLEWARRAVEAPVPGVERRLATLTESWKDAIAGGRRTVILYGEDGAGRTLAAELALRLHAEGALVLYGRWDQDVTSPYQAFREALGVYADGCSTDQLRADLEGRGEEIALLLPDVGARVSSGRPAVPDAYDERLGPFEAVEAWLRAVTRRTATLFVLDDLHWAELASLRLLDRLHLASASLPMLIVVTTSAHLIEAGDARDALDACVAQAEAEEYLRLYL